MGRKKRRKAHTQHIPDESPQNTPFLIPFFYSKKKKELLICSPQTLDKMFSTIHSRIFPRILCTKRAWNSIDNAIVIWVTKVRNLEQSTPWILKIVSHYSCVKSLCGRWKGRKRKKGRKKKKKTSTNRISRRMHRRLRRRFHNPMHSTFNHIIRPASK